MVPLRISIVSYNIWMTERWPARAPALERFLQLYTPDVLCLQELQATTQAFLDEKLSGHARVHDALPGWTSESNIYWKRDFFDEEEHGAEPIGHVEPERRFFWVRLKVRSTAKTIFVSTAHLTPPRRTDEPETGVSPRVGQLKRIGAELARLVRPGEPAFFMGDMNDAWHPQQTLRKFGYTSCFAALGQQSPPTYQCYPTVGIEPGLPTLTEAIDFLLANAPARAIAAGVPHVYAGDMAPSDHWPVHAIYELA